MKGLMGKPPTYLSTRPAGWEQQEQARQARRTAEQTRVAQLQAEVNSYSYRCGGMSDQEREEFRNKISARTRGAQRWHGVALGK